MRRGFANVSIDDIVSASGLNRYAIYSAFGTKADFFRACVRRYCTSSVDALEKLANDPSISPKEAVRRNLYTAAEDMCESHAGCLVCENLTDMRQHTPELAEYCLTYYSTKEGIIARLLSSAQKSGSFPAGIDPAHAAAAFMIFKFGLSNEVKRNAGIDLLRRKIDAFVSSLFHG